MNRNIIILTIIFTMILCCLSTVNASDNDLNQTVDLDDINQEPIIKKEVKIDASDMELYCRNGSRYSVTLLDDSNKPISNQSIVISINEVPYNRTTNIDGKTSIAINLNPGKYIINIFYNGTELYEKCEVNISVLVLPTILSGDVTKYFGNDTHYFATFLDKHGNPLVNTKVQFNINGVFYTRTTDNDGNAFVAINLPVGEYILTAIQEDNNFQKSSIIKVLSTIIANNVTKYFGNDTHYSATFLDNTGKGLANTSVQFNINGVFYNRITDGNGVASMAINLPVGEYILTAIQKNNNFQFSNSISVLSTIIANNITKYFKNNTDYHATFLDSTGKPLVKTVVKFNINGVFYSRTTSNKGITKISINLPPGEYIVTAIQESNNFQYSSFVKVLPTIESNDLVKAFQDDNQYITKFLDETGKPLVKTVVKFNINGIFYNRTTDNEGIAKLPINLPVGEYIITVFNSNDGYESSNIIKVLDNVKTIINVDNSSKLEGSMILKAQLQDELGYNLSNKIIKLSVNSNTYSAKTDKNGMADFSVNLKHGDYVLNYDFEATEPYLATTTTADFYVRDGEEVFIKVMDDILYNEDFFTIVLRDENNTLLSNVAVFFDINGKYYNLFSDEKGIINVNLKLEPGTYKAVYNVNQKGYDSRKHTTVFNVVASNEAKFTTNTTSVYQDLGEKFQVLLTSGNVALSNQKIIIRINNVDYKRTTNSEGLASITINLNPGYYNITCIYNGSSKLLKDPQNFNLVVLEKIKTNIKYLGGYSYDVNSNEPFTVLLSDSNNNPIANQKVVISVIGLDFNFITDSEGKVTLPMNLNEGVYAVNYRFDGLREYLPSSGVSEIHVSSKKVTGNGYWLFGGDMYKPDLANLAKLGTENIFLNFYAFTKYGESSVVSWIKKANSYGIRVHIWMQAFYDGDFLQPALTDGTPNYSLLNKKINEAKYYASVEGVSGVHMDYLRYPGTAYKHPGGTAAINWFVKSCCEAVRSINPNIIVSAAIMPETSSNIYYYGQDISVLSTYLDAIVPMIYKGNYNAGTNWIGSTTKWFVEHSKGAQIWAGLQAYGSDSNVVPLSVSELSRDASAAIQNGATGVVMFRWGITNFIDFYKL